MLGRSPAGAEQIDTGRITQRVDPSALDELSELPPRAAIAWVEGGRIESVPVDYRRRAGRHWIGVAREGWPTGGAPDRAVLLIDAGRYWFELRALTLRGRLAAAAPPPGDSPGLVWLELEAEHVVAWDYATLHEEDSA